VSGADALSVLGALVESDGLGKRAQIIAAIGTVLMLIFVIELVRRRRLVERYALLWMLAALVMVVLAVWNDALQLVADALGIISPPNALFLLGLAGVLAMLLNFSVAVSRLSEESKILAQIVARLDGEVRSLRGAAANGNGARRDDRTEALPATGEAPVPEPPEG
jgi:hypothetical protein